MTALGYGLWPPFVLLSEVVQTFILADFCYYYVKRLVTNSFNFLLLIIYNCKYITNFVIMIAVLLVASWCCGFHPELCEEEV